MRMKMTIDGSVFEVTPRQIVEAMQFIAFGQENRTLGEYIDWLVGQVERLKQMLLKIGRDTDDEKAAFLVQATPDCRDVVGAGVFLYVGASGGTPASDMYVDMCFSVQASVPRSGTHFPPGSLMTSAC